MTETKPKRRWFRFSLRTLFVLVTLFGIWLANQLNWIRQRHEFLSRSDLVVSLPYEPTAQPPWSLRLFGEVPFKFGIDVPRSELERVRNLFPECKVTAEGIKLLPNGSNPNALPSTRPPR